MTEDQLSREHSEALRVYFARAAALPVVFATPAEIRALKRARRNYLAGNTITLDEYEKRRTRRQPH